MSDTSHPSDELFTLQRQSRLNQLRLKIARQNEALSSLRQAGHRDTLEGYYDPANYFDPRDYLFETPRFAGAVPTTLNDRDEGRNYPIFRTEQDLALIRGAARWLTASNPIALGVLTSLTNYVIGNGFQYAAAARSTAGKQLAATANDVIDEFLDENDWLGDLDRELFHRSRIDGEYFLGLWHIGGGHVQARTIEPDQVTEPTNKSGLEAWLGCNSDGGSRAAGFVSNWGFGVQTHEVDAQAIHGFYVQWSNRDTDWDYFPGGNEPIVSPDGPGMWLEHAKLNVVRSVKRGLSDFYPIDGNLELARRVLRNMGEGSAVQAAIAWIQEVAPGTTQAQVHSGTLSRADGSYTRLTQQGSRAQATQHYDPATILKVPSGQKYLPGPLGTQHAPNFITAAEALLRTVALRWNLPENLITGSAANNNFASALVAETPFVKYAESQQQFYAQRDRKTLWRVLRFAWQAGRFGDVPWNALKRSLDITVTPPQVEVCDPEKETKVRQMLNAAGVLSKKTWSAQESLDFEQEQKNLLQEAAASDKDQATPNNNPASASHDARTEHEPPIAIAPESNDHDSEVPAENMEAWDATKHPRGGHPENRGWFSKVFGATAKAVSALRANKSNGVRALKDSSTPDAHPDGGADQSDAPKDGAHADGTLRGLRVPKDMVSQRDADMLAKAAEDVFRNSPIDNWVVDANIALAKLKAMLGRELSADLEEKFMAYVKAQQENAQWRRELEDNLLKLGSLDNLPAGDDRDVATVLLDVSQMGLDLAGILDPTPASDGTNTLISFWRGEWLDASISAVSMIPYLGDLAKLGKLRKYPAKIARAIQLALKSEKAAELLRPLLKQLDKLLQRIPLGKLPERLRGPLENVKKQLDNFFGRVKTPAKEPGTALVPASTVELGKWGEARLANDLGHQGVKPSSPFKTSLTKRFVDRLVNGVAHEAKAGRNVKLTATIRKQAMKDAELIKKGKIKGAVWHFYQGATKELLDFLDKHGIQYVVH